VEKKVKINSQNSQIRYKLVVNASFPDAGEQSSSSQREVYELDAPNTDIRRYGKEVVLEAYYAEERPLRMRFETEECSSQFHSTLIKALWCNCGTEVMHQAKCFLEIQQEEFAGLGVYAVALVAWDIPAPEQDEAREKEGSAPGSVKHELLACYIDDKNKMDETILRNAVHCVFDNATTSPRHETWRKNENVSRLKHMLRVRSAQQGNTDDGVLLGPWAGSTLRKRPYPATELEPIPLHPPLQDGSNESDPVLMSSTLIPPRELTEQRIVSLCQSRSMLGAFAAEFEDASRSHVCVLVWHETSEAGVEVGRSFRDLVNHELNLTKECSHEWRQEQEKERTRLQAALAEARSAWIEQQKGLKLLASYYGDVVRDDMKAWAAEYEPSAFSSPKRLRIDAGDADQEGRKRELRLRITLKKFVKDPTFLNRKQSQDDVEQGNPQSFTSAMRQHIKHTTFKTDGATTAAWWTQNWKCDPRVGLVLLLTFVAVVLYKICTTN